MALSDSAIRNAKPAGKPYKVYDDGGLFLLISPAGGKLWRLKYRYGGKEKLLSFGGYPDVSLKDARERRDAARKLLAADIDPGAEKKRKAVAATIAAGNTFKSVADSFIAKREKDGLAETTVTKAKWFLSILEADIGKRPMSEIEPHEILTSLKKIEKLGNNETAKRVRAFADRVFRYAIISGYAKHNPAVGLGEALASPKVTHHAGLLDPTAVGGLLRAIDGYDRQAQLKFNHLLESKDVQRHLSDFEGTAEHFIHTLIPTGTGRVRPSIEDLENFISRHQAASQASEVARRDNIPETEGPIFYDASVSNLSALISRFETASALAVGKDEDNTLARASDKALDDLFDYQPASLDEVRKKVQ